MSELAVTALRLGYLALLWFFVISMIAVLRSDIYGTRIRKRRSARAGQAVDTAEPPASRPKPRRSGGPTQLVVTAGPLAGVTMNLGSAQILIGRSASSTLVLDDDFSSSRHARLFPQPDGWYVEDLGSTNGTFLDNERVERPTPIPVGKPIHIGQSVLELRR